MGKRAKGFCKFILVIASVVLVVLIAIRGICAYDKYSDTYYWQ